MSKLSISLKPGTIVLILGLILFLSPFGIFKILLPVNAEKMKYTILILGIMLIFGFLLISIALLIYPKYLCVPYALFFFLCSTYCYETSHGIKSMNMVPPPEWNTQQYGWPLANRKVTTHTIGRKDVKITEHFSWKNSVINLCIEENGVTP
jgi:hypothetical protein